MSDYLPDELIVKIFEKLPVKSLFRCSFVCKSWYSIIRNPSFITQHLKRVNSPDQIVKNEKIVFLASLSDVTEIGFYSLNSDNSFHKHSELDSSRSGAMYEAELVGCCSGLVCLLLISNKDIEVKRFVIWNPSIRKSVSFMSTRSPLPMSYGFFVHPTTHQYKVAAFPLASTCHAEIYRQHIGAWSVINSAFPNFIPFSEATVNGVIHWIVDNNSNSIVLFNMHTEAFSEMAVPPSLVHKSVLSLKLTFSLEYPVLYDMSHELNYSEVWVMKEYGVSESWTKLFRIELPGGWHRALGLRMNGEFLLRTSAGLLCYDPLTNRTTTIAIDGIARSWTDTYVESLLLLNVNCSSEHESFGEFQ